MYKIRENIFNTPIFLTLFTYSGTLHGDRLYRILHKSRETCKERTNFSLRRSVYYDFRSTSSHETHYNRTVLPEKLFTKFDPYRSRILQFKGKNPLMLLITVAELFFFVRTEGRGWSTNGLILVKANLTHNIFVL
jgi:hypothetical protein